MANEIAYQNIAGTQYALKDGTARATANGAVTEAEYDRQLADNIYAGRNIETVSEFAAEIASAGNVYKFLSNRAKAANFAGLRLGDYINVPAGIYGTVRFDIASFDHYYQCADQAIGHHLVFLAHTPISLANAGEEWVTNGSYLMWNDENTNQGTEEEPNPYLCSKLHRWEIEEFLPSLPDALQAVLLDHRSMCESRYSASGGLTASTTWAWKSLGKIWSPSEMEVYGCRVWGTPGYSVGMDSQFPLLRESKNRLNGARILWWLRVVSGSSASYVCYVSSTGDASGDAAAGTWVRPRVGFLLG